VTPEGLPRPVGSVKCPEQVERFGENVNSLNRTETVVFRVHGTGTDGSRITFTDGLHFTVTATGVETGFERPTCH
jgi:hypothetical protein